MNYNKYKKIESGEYELVKGYRAIPLDIAVPSDGVRDALNNTNSMIGVIFVILLIISLLALFSYLLYKTYKEQNTLQGPIEQNIEASKQSDLESDKSKEIES